jgi:hypothetical protein
MTLHGGGRSHVFYRAQRHQWEVGLSSPNRILDKTRKQYGAATSFRHQQLRPMRDQLLFIELIDQIYLQAAHPPFEVARRLRVLDHCQVLTA